MGVHGVRVTIGGIAFAATSVTRLVLDGMAWRAAVFAMLPFALLALSFGWIVHTKKDRALVWVRSLWGVTVLAVVLVESSSGK